MFPRAAEPTTHQSYTERMKKQWYELNLRRLLFILMSRKRVNEKLLNEQTVLEKERLAYEAAKKESLADVLKRVGDEVAGVRMRIYPMEIPDLERSDMIQTSVNKIMLRVDPYTEIESEANSIMDGIGSFEDIDYVEFLDRGAQRRKLLNKSLGGNTERYYWYETKATEDQLTECDWGFETFADLLHDVDYGTKPPSETSLLLARDEGESRDDIVPDTDVIQDEEIVDQADIV